MANAGALRGTHVVVTGATTPLARALAVALAEGGATVSVTTSRAELAEEVLANSILNETWSVGSQGQAKTVDLTSGSSIDTAVDALEREIAPIDVLVNIVDAAAAMSVCLAAAGRMFLRRSGRIINVVPPDASEAARAAVLGLTQRLTDDWEQRGLTLYTLMIDDPQSAEARDALVSLVAGTSELPVDLPAATVPVVSEPLPEARPPIVRPPAGTPGPSWGGDGALRDAAAPRPAPASIPAPEATGPRPAVVEPLVGGLVLAPLWRRAVAWGFDLLLKIIIFDIVLIASGAPEVDVSDGQIPMLPLHLVIAFHLLARGYDFIFGVRGRSPAAGLFGIRVVRAEDGGDPGVGRSLLRAAGILLSEQALGIGFLWALRSPKRQGWADRMAGTIVLRTPRKP